MLQATKVLVFSQFSGRSSLSSFSAVVEPSSLFLVNVTLLWMHQLRNPDVEVRGSQEKSLAQLFFISINPPSG